MSGYDLALTWIWILVMGEAIVMAFYNVRWSHRVLSLITQNGFAHTMSRRDVAVEYMRLIGLTSFFIVGIMGLFRETNVINTASTYGHILELSSVLGAFTLAVNANIMFFGNRAIERANRRPHGH